MYPENSSGDDDTGIDIFDFIVLPKLNCYSILCGCIGFVWNQIKKIPLILCWLFTFIYSMFGYYLIWVTLHYLAVHLYPMYCAPLTITGFILSPFMVSTTHCIAMRWLITEGSNVIVTMWLAIGAYAIQKMLRRPNNV
jgi:hypothetical protein